jgi:hypothetical protein
MRYLRWIIAAIAIAAIAAESARADMGYIPPVNIHLRFDNLDDYPDYDFYLKYGIAQGNPYAGLRLMKLTAASTLTKLEGEGRRLTLVYLMAVPRGRAVAPPPPLSQDVSWLNAAPEGAIQSELRWKDDYQLDNHNGCSAFYRISLDGKQLTATWVGGEEPPATSPWRWAAFAGIALSVIIAVIGLVWIKRRRRIRS